MLARPYVALALLSTGALVFVAAPVAAPASYVDDFPSGLSDYRTGGWQWPYNDGTGAGSVAAGPDNWSVYMDATYNALAYAIRQTPEMYDFTVSVDFVIPTRDYTPGDQFFLHLRWNNSTYPDQSQCPACLFPTADSGVIVDFFLGEQRLILIEVKDQAGFNRSDRPFDLTIGRAHNARVQLAGATGRVYVDGVQEIEVANLSSPAGLFGIVAYREDVILDRVQIDVLAASGPATPPTPPPPTGPTNPPGSGSGISLVSPWVVAPAAWVIGLVSGLLAIRLRERARRSRKRP